MLSLVELKKAIVKRLKVIEGIKVVANDIRSGFEKPAFFVQVMPLGITTDCDIQERIITVYINYFSEEKTEIDNLRMLDKLNCVFVNTLSVNDEVFTLYDKDSDIDENILKFMFTLKFTEDVPTPMGEEQEIYEEMNDLYMNI